MTSTTETTFPHDEDKARAERLIDQALTHGWMSLSPEQARFIDLVASAEQAEHQRKQAIAQTRVENRKRCHPSWDQGATLQRLHAEGHKIKHSAAFETGVLVVYLADGTVRFYDRDGRTYGPIGRGFTQPAIVRAAVDAMCAVGHQFSADLDEALCAAVMPMVDRYIDLAEELGRTTCCGACLILEPGCFACDPEGKGGS